MISSIFTSVLLLAACAFAADNKTTDAVKPTTSQEQNVTQNVDTPLAVPSTEGPVQLTNTSIVVPTGVTVYYESLCPDSQAFITTQFYPVFEKMSEYLNVTLVPYGKATMEKNETATVIKCHHGEQECVGNKLQACILEGTTVPATAVQMKLINCLMMDAKKDSPYPSAKVCVDKVGGLDATVSEALDKCVTSKGDELLMKYGEKTNEFENPLVNVPAVAINNVKDKAAIGDFQNAICNKINGQKPEVCSKKNSASVPGTITVLPIIVGFLLVKL